MVKKAKIAEADGILGMMRGAEIRYYAENGSYTAATSNLDVDIPVSIYFNYSIF